VSADCGGEGGVCAGRALFPGARGSGPRVFRVRAGGVWWGRVSECCPDFVALEHLRRRRVIKCGSCTALMTRPVCGGAAIGASDGCRARAWGGRAAQSPPGRRSVGIAATARASHARLRRRTQCVRARGVQVHKVRTLHPADATRRHAIPITSPARTLLDLAAITNDRDLSRAVDEARVTRLATDISLNEQCSRYPHHRGTAALKGALQQDPALTRSEAERRLLELIRKARLPEPQTNALVRGYEVDLLWPDQRLIATLARATAADAV
jgi:hypothetical protein